VRPGLLFHAAHFAQGLGQLMASPPAADKLGGQSLVQEKSQTKQ